MQEAERRAYGGPKRAQHEGEAPSCNQQAMTPADSDGLPVLPGAFFLELQADLEAVAASLHGAPVELEPLRVSRHPWQGVVASNAPLRLAVLTGRPAPEMARTMLERLPTRPDWLGEVRLAGAGFLNFFLHEQAFDRILQDILARPQAGGTSPAWDELAWARDRRRDARNMAQARGLWPVQPVHARAAALTLDAERQLLGRIGLLALVVETAERRRDAAFLRHYLDGLLRAFHDFYARIPVLAMDESLARARLVLMEATLEVVEQGAARLQNEGFYPRPSNDSDLIRADESSRQRDTRGAEVTGS